MHDLKHIAVFMDASAAGERICRHAARLAQKHQAHLVGVSRAEAMPPSASFAVGSQAIHSVLVHLREVGEEKAAAAVHQFSELMREYGVSSEFRGVWSDSGSSRLLDRLHCDLVVTAQPKPEGLPTSWSAEHILLHNGGPILLIPVAWQGEDFGQHAVIAWNGSVKARRAINDAIPLLQRAGRVTVLVVDDGSAPERLGSSPGSDVLNQLQRHQIAATTEIVNASGRPIAEVIAAQADRLGADLVVIGAYSRSRAAEAIFGGVTRALLARAPRPLFIAH